MVYTPRPFRSVCVKVQEEGLPPMPPFDFAVQPGTTDSSLNLTPCGACPVRNMSVCAALHEDELGRLADIVTTIRLDAHDTLFSEGDPAANMYNVTSGT